MRAAFGVLPGSLVFFLFFPLRGSPLQYPSSRLLLSRWCRFARLKNEASMFSQTVRSFNMQHRLLLTGTPLQVSSRHEARLPFTSCAVSPFMVSRRGPCRCAVLLYRVVLSRNILDHDVLCVWNAFGSCMECIPGFRVFVTSVHAPSPTSLLDRFCSGGLQNNLHELWALLNFLLPDVFSSSEQFDQVNWRQQTQQ